MYTKPKPQPPQVTCASCRHFLRDTSGPSYNIYTHVFFMGTCKLGLQPDTKIKQFANRKHQCNEHKELLP